MATATTPQAAGIIGAAVPRIDGPVKTTGTALYAVDHDFPGLAHAVAVQSTVGSGRIRKLDASAAEQMPGVLLIFHHGNMEKSIGSFRIKMTRRRAKRARRLKTTRFITGASTSP